ncbi:MAG: exodeoxyribonuclease VII large subunit [Chthoniobacterales bacterium]
MARDKVNPPSEELNLWSTPTAPAPAPAPPETPKVLRVTDLTRIIRDLLEGKVGSLWVEGEVSNLRKQSSGHQYFTLKDESAQISCVIFRNTPGASSVEITDGMHIEVFGQVTVYEARGQYQLIIRKLATRGAGALQAKFEALKNRLMADGIFDAERKKELPAYPRRIGIITSPTGAALQDFLRVLQTRVSAELILAPVRVQGTGASREIVEAINRFSNPPTEDLRVDVIALIRGGGSLEDLWEFNEEIVARAIADCAVPIITGIGHEIDFTIADFASDLRAPTPSAAAAALLPEKTVIYHRLFQQLARLRQVVHGRHQFFQSQLQSLARSGVFREPARRIKEMALRLDDSLWAISRSAAQNVRVNRLQLDERIRALQGKRPTHVLALHRHQLAAWLHRLQTKSQHTLGERQAQIGKIEAILQAFNPQKTLERGFTMTTDDAGKPVVSAKEARKLPSLTTIFHDGKVRSKPTP